jgi:predicted RNase H-like HicB family nuclease
MKNRLIFNNTYVSGRARVFIYEDKGKYIAVCLEFGLVVSAKTLEKARECIQDVTQSYLSNVLENKLSVKLLNRPAPKKYWKIYEEIIHKEQGLAKLQSEQSRPLTSFIPRINLPAFLLFNQNYRNGAFINS